MARCAPPHIRRSISSYLTHISRQILSASTILKSDFFKNLQKQSLPESVPFLPARFWLPADRQMPPSRDRRVDGAPNYRKADAAVTASRDGALSARKVYGTGMPSSAGLRQALDKMGAGKDGKEVVYWTSLRE